jgi:hypothetical protein
MTGRGWETPAHERTGVSRYHCWSQPPLQARRPSILYYEQDLDVHVGRGDRMVKLVKCDV